MTFLRVFPGSPNWLMNITFAHIPSIPTHKVALSIFFGLMPWNYFTCTGGEVLSKIQSKSDVVNSDVYFQLILIAGGVLLPVIGKKLLGIDNTVKVEIKSD